MTPDRPLFLQNDELYGEIVFTQEENRLINTPQIQRLNDISLSAVPPITLGRQIPTRLEHSIGVAHLAKVVGQKSEFSQFSKELFAAGITHDVGSPPFSHLSERYLLKVFGISHEKFAEVMVLNSGLSSELEAQGIDTNTILKIIDGQLKPVSDVISGSLDVDNLDNIQRYGKAMGIIGTPLYSGERLARAYTLHNGSIALKAGSEMEVEGWLESRHKVYRYVYSSENQVMGAMTSRALYFAYESGELDKEFFYWTDTKAYGYLLEGCNQRTRKIARLASERSPFTVVTDLLITKPSETFIGLCGDSDNRDSVANSLADRFSIPREDICVYFGKSRNFRKIHLTTINGRGTNGGNGIQQEWTAQVFIHPEHNNKFRKLDIAFKNQIGLANE